MTPPAWAGPDIPGREWDARVASFRDASIFQSSAWAEHRRGSGWAVERWSVHSKELRAAVQLLVRRSPIADVVWAPGGPIVEPPDADPSLTAEIVDGMLARIRARRRGVYVRFDAPAPPTSAVETALARRCLRPAMRLNAPSTVVVDLTRDRDAMLAAMSKHHRYEVRRALAQGVDWTVGRGPVEVATLVTLHRDMTRRKGIGTAPQARSSAIRSLCAAFGDDALIVVGSIAGTPVTACFTLTFGARAFFHTAATAGRGLRSSASYAAVHRLALELAARGIRELDLGGLDQHAMPGVARFKEGFGGRVVSRTGEWDWCSHASIRALAQIAMRLRSLAT